jgi:hypothetical protein
MMSTTTVETTDITQIANFLVEQCQNKNFCAVMERFYADNIVSVEPITLQGQTSPITEGLPAVLAMSQHWEADNEVHSCTVSQPIITGSHFAVTMQLDVTCKSMGNARFTMEEIAVYEVQNGKIVRQQFFYSTQK